MGAEGRLRGLGPLGEGNATVERAEPTRYRGDWGAATTVAPELALTFVSGAADPGLRGAGTQRRLVPVLGVRGLTRADLARNRATAPIEIDPLDGRVTLAGRPLAVQPGPRSRSRGATCSDDYQMSRTMNPSGNGSLGSTT